MEKWRWFDRPFQFDFPTSKMPDILERLRGTPARLEERLRDIPAAALIRREGESWSIQENVGHLVDLEALHLRRIDEILAGRPTLTGADPENRRTHVARHNERPLAELLRELRTGRGELVTRMEALPPTDWGRSSIHPRLRQPMRMVDLAFFCAEHDDYHLARIGELLRKFARSP